MVATCPFSLAFSRPHGASEYLHCELRIVVDLFLQYQLQTQKLICQLCGVRVTIILVQHCGLGLEAIEVQIMRLVSEYYASIFSNWKSA